MVNSEIRPNNYPPEIKTILYAEKPKRNSKLAQEAWIKVWSNLIDTSWPRLSITATHSLTENKDAVLKPDLLTEASRNDQFRFNTYDIATQIVTIGTPQDIKNVLNYFNIGREVEQNYNEKSSGQKAYRLSREELFQIFTLVLGKLEIAPDTKARREKMRKQNKARKKMSQNGYFKLETEIEKVFSYESDTLYSDFEEEVQPIKTESSIILIKAGTEKKKIQFHRRPPILDPITEKEIERLMRERPERGGPMMNVH